MDNESRNYLKNKTLYHSFKNALNGFRQAAISEKNMRIHVGAAFIVVLVAVILKVDSVRWAVLILTIGLVLVSELLNTSIEKLTDMVTNEYSEEAKKVKDIAATAVLIGAVISVIVGIVVLYQPILNFLL